MKAPVIRVSIGFFDPDKVSVVEKNLMATKLKLEADVRAMPGNISYSAGIDRTNNAIINVSMWNTVGHANQMEGFQPMQELAREFIALGVRFQRPILNFETTWEIP